MTFKINQPNITIQNRYFLSVDRISGNEFELAHDNACYFVMSQNSELITPAITVVGMYAAVVEHGTVQGDAVVVKMMGIKRIDAVSMVDSKTPGDLSYIDGCSNSVLIVPPRNGDPCLNYLYFPAGVDQTFHTHPSVRVGIVVGGSGIAEYYEGSILKTTRLNTGDSFVIDRHGRHRFCTKDSTMSIIAFHPDSEDGPRDEHNPMKTRTYIK